MKLVVKHNNSIIALITEVPKLKTESKLIQFGFALALGMHYNGIDLTEVDMYDEEELPQNKFEIN